jgi:hypothetical protein
MASQNEPNEATIAFNKWLRENGERLGYYQLPSQLISKVHTMLRRAHRAGVRFEQKQHESIFTGGAD